jgi:hypothetical protein
LYQVRRRAHRHNGLAHIIANLLVGQFGARMRGDNDGIATLHGGDGLDHRCRFGIGGRRQRADHADRFSNLYDIAYRVFLDHADGFVADDIHQGCARFAVDLEVLALVISELGFFHRKTGNFLRAILASHGPDHGSYELIDLFLGVVFYLPLGRACAHHHCSVLLLVAGTDI